MTRHSRFGEWFSSHALTHVLPLAGLVLVGTGCWCQWGYQAALIVVGGLIWLDCLVGSLLQ